MTSNRRKFFLNSILMCALALSVQACGRQIPSTDTPEAAALPPLPPGVDVNQPNSTSLPALSGDNVLGLSVNGTNCANPTYPNKPCITLTVCDGANHCLSIPDVLVDTGSYGLRVFSSVLSSAPTPLSLDPVTSGALPVAECVQYGDGSKQWGPVKTARVMLGNEPAVTVPIQVVDSTFTGMTANCNGAMATPEEGGFNAILGLGLFQHDCGLNCAISALNGNYYACDSGTGTCSGAAVSLAHQVQNPVSLLPTDHNGVILQLPDLAATGATSAEGYLILGIGTRSNNVPDPAVHAFKANSSYGEFITRFEGQDDPSFIDSGSNSFAFPNGGANLAICSYPYSGWFCPAGLSDLSATTISADQSISGAVPFQIGSFLSFANSANFASKTIGAAASSGISGFFDWGLPFYFGKNVYHGIEGQSSSLGQGPYWAY